jgi:DNA modification methylase
MIWQSCLDVDFGNIDYDFVLTSPPYINMEIYEHMTPWQTKDMFYTDFFMPLWQKTMDNIEPGGKVCYNISPKMFTEAQAHGLPEPDITEDLLQQLGQQTGKKKQDKVYIWQA